MSNTNTAEPVAAESVKVEETTTVPKLEKLPPEPKDNSSQGRIADKLARKMKPVEAPEPVKEVKDASEEKIDNIIKEEVKPTPVVEEVKVESKITEQNRSFIKSLLDEEVPTTKESIEEQPVIKQYEEAKAKLTEYESVLKNPLVEAVAEFTKSGKSDLMELFKELGVVDTTKLTVEEMYRMKNEKLGFEGDELIESVEEDLAKFESMTKSEKREHEAKLRDTYKAQSSDKLKSYTEKLTQERQRKLELDDKVSAQAEVDLDKAAEKLLTEGYLGLPMTQEMIDQVKKVVPALAPTIAKFDEKGNLTGYDVQDGIEYAAWKLYKKQISKNLFLMGRTDGIEEFQAERSRVNPNNTQISPLSTTGETKQEAVKAATKDVLKGMRGTNPFSQQNKQS